MFSSQRSLSKLSKSNSSSDSIKHLSFHTIDLFKSCMELCNIILFTIAGFILSYARYGKPRNGYDVMQLHARIFLLHCYKLWKITKLFTSWVSHPLHYNFYCIGGLSCGMPQCTSPLSIYCTSSPMLVRDQKFGHALAIKSPLIVIVLLVAFRTRVSLLSSPSTDYWFIMFVKQSDVEFD